MRLLAALVLLVVVLCAINVHASAQDGEDGAAGPKRPSLGDAVAAVRAGQTGPVVEDVRWGKGKREAGVGPQL